MKHRWLTYINKTCIGNNYMWRRVRAVALLLIAAIISVAGLVVRVHYITAPYRYTALAQVKPQHVALVFGAGVYPDGSLTPMLADRVQAAVDLYHQRRVAKLLMSGDNSRVTYNEVEAMQRYAIAQGVPAIDITLDYAGFRTYDSCYRAKVIFGVEQAVLISQQYHMPRAIYTCHQFGIDAVGLGTPDWGHYSNQLLIRYTLREVIATLYALLELHITHPLPRFLGNYEGITR